MAQKNKASVRPVVVETKPRISRHAKKVGVIVGIIIIAAAVVLWVWAPWHKEAFVSNTITPQEYQQQVATVSGLAASGKDDEAIKQADSYLSQNLSSDQKAGLVEQKAAAYARKGDNDKAFTLYKECEKLQGNHTDIGTAQALMTMYNDRGDKQQAVAYARKLIAASQASSNPLEHSRIPGYKNFIRSLGETP